MKDLLVAGDFGGTKANLGLYLIGDGRPVQIDGKTFVSADYPGPGRILKEFIGEAAEGVGAACLGIAGPNHGGVWKPPNLPWRFTAEEVAAEAGLKRVRLINDLVAMAYAVPILDEDDLVSLNPEARAREGNAVLIAAGTGLGQSILFWNGREHVPSATEGSHTEFAPADETEIELLRYLWRELDHVSWERLVSGPGISTIFRFLKETGRGVEEDWLAERLVDNDPSAVIAQAALDGASPLCVETLRMFVGLYGRAAGNLALKGMAGAGVYVGGGIAPKILPLLQDGTFMAAFTAKGRMSELVASMPVKVILDEKAALKGAARRALMDLEKN